MVEKRFEYLELKQSQWAYILIVALIIVPLLIATLYSLDIYNAYVRELVAPKLQSKFGFSISHNRMYYKSQPLDVYVINSVESTGILAKAGVQVNDIPIGIVHKSDVMFYDDLVRSQEEPVEINVVNVGVYDKWLKTQGFSLFEHQRKIVVPKQSEN